jgi:MFS superfamily sulfate permease-like transporter
LADFATALTLLVIPQLPLTFANSCLAPADAARQYFGDAARRVTPGRLAITLGAANIVAGGISGMPVCHGAGGLSAHYAFGARTWRAPVIIGSALLVVACVFGQVAGSLLPMFPVSLLAALLGVAAITHALLLRDVHGWRDWLVVLTVATLGVFANLAYGVVIGLLLAGVLTRSVAPKPTS